MNSGHKYDTSKQGKPLPTYSTVCGQCQALDFTLSSQPVPMGVCRPLHMWSGLSQFRLNDMARSGPNGPKLGANIGCTCFCVSLCALSILARDIDSFKSDVFDVNL